PPLKRTLVAALEKAPAATDSVMRFASSRSERFVQLTNASPGFGDQRHRSALGRMHRSPAKERAKFFIR
ncbi:MAG: hypothetical protein ABLT11_09600, partial [Candidatus Acidiferrum sp.]